MSRKNPETVREQIFASYASLSMAHIALDENVSSYNKKCYAMREIIFKDLMSGKKSPRSLFDDARDKMSGPKVCSYCGSREPDDADHLIPKRKWMLSKRKGDLDSDDNAVPACRSCNLSKGSKDMLEWMYEKNKFPSISLLRRYLKLVHRWCKVHGCMDKSFPDDFPEMPFDLRLLPLENLPAASELQWQVQPAEE